MEKRNFHLRIAKPEDAEEILKVYAPYVEKTAITFEYEVPSVEEFRGRIENTLQHYPYLVAEDETGILGYAYAGRFQTRAAYDWAVETSIYIRMDQKRRGLGRILYDALEEGLKEQGILNVNACIACTDQEDEHLTNDSIYFHKHLGYRLVGKFYQCGYKVSPLVRYGLDGADDRGTQGKSGTDPVVSRNLYQFFTLAFEKCVRYLIDI